MNRTLTRAGTLITAAALALSLSACGGQASADEGGDEAQPSQGTVKIADYASIEVYEVPVKGKTVTCVLYDGYKAGGLSCDFEPLHVPTPSS